MSYLSRPRSEFLPPEETVGGTTRTASPPDPFQGKPTPTSGNIDPLWGHESVWIAVAVGAIVAFVFLMLTDPDGTSAQSAEQQHGRTAACRILTVYEAETLGQFTAIENAVADAMKVAEPDREADFLDSLAGADGIAAATSDHVAAVRRAATVPNLSAADYDTFADLAEAMLDVVNAASPDGPPSGDGPDLLYLDRIGFPALHDAHARVTKVCGR